MIAVVLALALVQQNLERRVAAAPDGTVRLSFAARPGVCGDGRASISFDCTDGGCGRRTVFTDGRDAEVQYDCEPGPVRVSLSVAGGRVTALRTYVGGRWRAVTAPPTPAAVTDLGTVGAREAAAYLVALAAKDNSRAAEHAVFPATLADSATVWPDVLRLARDAGISRRVRRRAIFWLAQSDDPRALALFEELLTRP